MLQFDYEPEYTDEERKAISDWKDTPAAKEVADLVLHLEPEQAFMLAAIILTKLEEVIKEVEPDPGEKLLYLIAGMQERQKLNEAIEVVVRIARAGIVRQYHKEQKKEAKKSE